MDLNKINNQLSLRVTELEVALMKSIGVTYYADYQFKGIDREKSEVIYNFVSAGLVTYLTCIYEGCSLLVQPFKLCPCGGVLCLVIDVVGNADIQVFKIIHVNPSDFLDTTEELIESYNKLNHE